MSKSTTKKAVKSAKEPGGDKKKIAKAELTQRVAKETGLTREEAGKVVGAVTKLTIEALKQGKTVGLMGLGTLSITHTKERQGVRPGTTDRITIPAGKKVRFKPSTALKQDINQ